MATPMKHKASEPADAAWEAFLAICGEAGGEAFTTQVQQALGLRALAHLTHRMENGCLRSAKEIADRCLGVPEVPLSVRSEKMDPVELRETMRRRYEAVWHWKSPEEITRMLDALEGRDTGDGDDGENG